MAAKFYLDGWGAHSPRAKRRAAALEAGQPGAAKTVALLPALSGKEGLGSGARLLLVQVELPPPTQAGADAAPALAGSGGVQESIQTAVQRAVPGGRISITAAESPDKWHQT